MKLKYFLLILLLLVLFLNFMTQEHFIDTLKDQLDQKIDDIISTGNINDPIHQSKIRSHSITPSDSNTLTHYSLKNNKVLLTLFYDKYNEHSLNFYDYNYKTIEHNIFKLDKEIYELQIQLYDLIESSTNSQAAVEYQSAPALAPAVDEQEAPALAPAVDEQEAPALAPAVDEQEAPALAPAVEYQATPVLYDEITTIKKIIQKKNLDRSAYIKNILPKKNTWNFLKHKHVYDNKNPYINQELLILEEVKCDGNEISKCIENPSVILEKNTLKEIPTEQPPRSETLIDKLPKVILSFLKPIDIIDKNIQYEYIIAEYDGIYSMNEPEKPLAYHNILHFIQETLDKHLEIKKEEKKDHEDKFGHTFDKVPINTIIKAEAPLYLDYNIYKCNECCLYYKEKN
jgi:hypothetical protein